MKKKVAITQSNYIPWKGYFDSIHMVDEFIIYDDMQFTKRDWRNRNKIKTPTGAQWLTIPVVTKGRYYQKINEVEIMDNSWGRKHWNIIKHNYNRAPYFREFHDLFEELYLTINENKLSKINEAFIKTICSVLDINTSINYSHNFHLGEGKTKKLIEICKKVDASEYFTGPAAKEYIDENLFIENNIKLKYFDYSGYKEYTQLYPPFIHSVSILDLIFNTGANAVNYMKSKNKLKN